MEESVRLPEIDFNLRLSLSGGFALPEHLGKIRLAFEDYFRRCGYIVTIQNVETTSSNIVVTIDRDYNELTSQRYPIAGQEAIVQVARLNNTQFALILRHHGSRGLGPEMNSTEGAGRLNPVNGEVSAAPWLTAFQTEVSATIPARITQMAWAGSRVVAWVEEMTLILFEQKVSWDDLLLKLPKAWNGYRCFFFKRRDRHFKEYPAASKMDVSQIARVSGS